jgi:hypothetical protein
MHRVLPILPMLDCAMSVEDSLKANPGLWHGPLPEGKIIMIPEASTGGENSQH